MTKTLFWTTKTSNFLVTHYFYGGRNCRMCLPNILFPVSMFAFIFHWPSFTPCWPLAFLIFSPPLWIFMFFFLRNSSPLFSITRSSSFFVIHLSVNIKNNVEEDTTLLLFFLSKSSGGHVISFQINPWVAFELLYLSIELFYIGMPVVRMDGRQEPVKRAGGNSPESNPEYRASNKGNPGSRKTYLAAFISGSNAKSSSAFHMNPESCG